MEGDILWGVDLERDQRLERRSLSRLLSAVGLTMLIFLLAALSTGLPVNLLRWYWESHGIPITDTLAQLVNMASYTYSLLLPLLFFVLFQGPRRVGRPLFPLGRPAPGVFFPALGFCLGICSFSNYLSSYVALLIREALHQPVPTYRAAIPESGLPMVLGILSAAVLPAVLEELLFRGAILQAARPFGDGFAILLSALAFTLCHTTVPQLIPALLAGLMFGFFTVLSGSLWVTVLIHCCYTLLAVAVELAGTTGGPEAQQAMALAIAAGSFLLWAGGTYLLCRRFLLVGRRMTGVYQGTLSGPERLARVFCNPPMLIATATLCWTTWEPVVGETLKRWS